jgi:hypothetical protein
LQREESSTRNPARLDFGAPKFHMISLDDPTLFSNSINHTSF